MTHRPVQCGARVTALGRLGRAPDGAAPPHPLSDEGSGTVLVLAVLAVVITVAGVLAVLVRGQAAGLAVHSAADLAALAGADAVALPDGIVLAADAAPDLRAACDRAAQVAERNGATLTVCDLSRDGVATIAVRGSRPWSATASARAGPGSARGGG